MLSENLLESDKHSWINFQDYFETEICLCSFVHYFYCLLSSLSYRKQTNLLLMLHKIYFEINMLAAKMSHNMKLG